jgi:RimJ/RimL family protein N-acetyltransferase
MVNKSIALETRRIGLREIQDGDLISIFQWRNTEKFRVFFYGYEKEVKYDEFCDEFIQDTNARKFQFLIVKKDTGEPVGLTFVHTYSEEYKSCFLNIFISEPFERKGYGTDVFVQFVLFLFNQMGLKKVFVQASDHNVHSIACIRKIGMRELAGNVEKKIYAGKEHDILCFAADQNLVPRLAMINKYIS